MMKVRSGSGMEEEWRMEDDRNRGRERGRGRHLGMR